MAIVDECQDFKSGWINTVKEHSKNQLWLGDDSQQIYSDSMNDPGYASIYSEFNERDIELATSLVKRGVLTRSKDPKGLFFNIVK